jgi:hypothetical protein
MDSGSDPTTDILRANLLHLFSLDGVGPRDWTAQARLCGLSNNGIKKIIEQGASATTTALDTMARHLGVPADLLLAPETRHLSRIELHRRRRLVALTAAADPAMLEIIERMLALHPPKDA